MSLTLIPCDLQSARVFAGLRRCPTMAENWDTKTADKCRMPELIPDICKVCRDYDYCHRPLKMEGFDNG